MRVAIIGASKGIGRDIQPRLQAYGHEVAAVPRGEMPQPGTDALFLCQRYRGEDEWAGELAVSLTRTKQIMEWAQRQHAPMAVVMMASVAGVSVEGEQPVSYHVGKAGLLAMMRYYADTLAPLIRVNAIIPGLTIKPEARAFYDSHPELEATYAAVTPMGRTCTVEDLAHTVSYLIDPKGQYVTGQVIGVDGGIANRSNWRTARDANPALRTLHVTQRKPAGRTDIPDREPDVWCAGRRLEPEPPANVLVKKGVG